MGRARARPAGCGRSPCVDQARCRACSECPPIDICPQRIIERDKRTGKAEIVAVDSCYGCLACVSICPLEAIWSD